MHLSVWPRRWIAAAMLTVGTSLSADASQSLPRSQWWHSEEFQRELALSAEQVARIDAVFQATLPELRQRKQELDRLEASLSRLIEADADEPTVAKTVDKTEIARSSLNKVRTLMLLRMRNVLRPDQRERFNTLHSERERLRAERRAQGAKRHDK